MAQNGNMSFELWMKQNVTDELTKIFEEFRKLDNVTEKSMSHLRDFARRMGDEIVEKSVWGNFSKLSDMMERVDKKIIQLRNKMGNAPVGTNNQPLLQQINQLRVYRQELDKVGKDKNLLSDKDAVMQVIARTRSAIAQVDKLTASWERNAQARRRANSTHNEKLRQENLALGEMARNLDKVTQAGNVQTRMWNALKGAVGTYFSMQGLYNFTRELITIGGEFEVQRIALQNIIGDIEKANGLFQQIKDMAVVSPFSFRQLASYTKQTAAYGIPEDELFETTKRLADMSAGLGVDMNRLILAYGQVRSAAVLRGPELRQFTEAGIPMVEALAKKFTELNGVATTTGEVFDLIKKKAVPFEMVKEVLWEMTDEGGRFNNMQFKLADTLAGKMSNLRDAWEIALSEMANSTSVTGKLLKGLLTLITNVISGASALSPILLGIGTGIIAGKIKGKFDYFMGGTTKNQISEAQRLTMASLERQRVEGAITQQQYRQRMNLASQGKNYAAILALEGRLSNRQIVKLINEKNLTREKIKQLHQMKLITDEQYRQYMSGGRVRNAGFGGGDGFMSFMKGGGWMIALDAAIAGITYFMNKEAEAQQRHEDFISSLRQNSSDLSTTFEEIRKLSPTSDADYYSAIERVKEVLKNEVSEDYYNSILQEIGGIDTLSSKYERLLEILKDIDAYKRGYDKTTALMEAINDRTDGNWDDSIETNARQAEEAIGKAEKYLATISSRLDDDVKKKIDEIARSSEKFRDNIEFKDNGRVKNYLEALRTIISETNDVSWQAYESDERNYTKVQDANLQTIYSQLDLSSQKEFRDLLDAEAERRSQWESLQEDLEIAREMQMQSMANEWGISLESLNSLLQGKFEDISESDQRQIAQNMDMTYEAFRANFAQNMAKARSKAKGELDTFVSQFLTYFKAAGTKIANKIRQVLIPVEFSFDVTAKWLGLEKLPTFLKEALEKAGIKSTTTGKGGNKQSRWYDKLGNELNEQQKEFLSGLGNPNEAYDKLVSKITGLKESIEKSKKINKKKNLVDIKKNEKDLRFYQETFYDIFGYYYVDEKEAKKATADARKAGAAADKLKHEAEKREEKYLKTIRDRISQYKKFRQTLEEEAKNIGAQSAFDMLKNREDNKELFDYFASLGLTQDDILDFRKSMTTITAGISGDLMISDARKNIKVSADNEILAFEAKQRKDREKKVNDELVIRLRILKEEYDTYKDLLELTGSHELSSQAVFGGIVGVSTYKEALEKELQGILSERGLKVSSDKVLSMKEEEVARVYGSNSRVMKIWKENQDYQVGLRKEHLREITELIKKTRNLEQQIEDENAQYERQAKLIREIYKYDPIKMVRALSVLGEEHDEKLAQLDIDKLYKDYGMEGFWSDFEHDSTESLRTFKSALEDMLLTLKPSTEAYEKVREAINDINQVLSGRNPFKAISESLKDLSAADRLRKYLKNNKGEVLFLKEAVAKQFGLKEGKYTRGWLNAYAQNTDKSAADSFTKAVMQINTGFEALSQVLQPVISLFDSLGKKDVGKIFNIASSSISSASNSIGALGSLKSLFKDGSAGSLAIGRAIPYVAAISAVLSIASSVISMGQEEIKEELKEISDKITAIEKLQQLLNDNITSRLGSLYGEADRDLSQFLKNSAGVPNDHRKWDAWAGQSRANRAIIDSLRSGESYDQLYAAKLLQVEQLKDKERVMREDKEATEGEKQELAQQLYEAREALNDFAKDMAKTLYDIDIKSWAKDLSQSIVDAWVKGGDALKAYKDKIKELLKTSSVDIVSQKMLELALKPVEALVENRMSQKSGKLDLQDMADIADLMMQGSDEAVENTIKLLDELKSRGYDFETTESSSNSISKNITENQADRLLSYVNAIRADVSVKRTDVTAIRRAVESISGDTNAIARMQIQRLDNIARNTERNAIAAEEIKKVLELARTDANFGFYGK